MPFDQVTSVVSCLFIPIAYLSIGFSSFLLICRNISYILDINLLLIKYVVPLVACFLCLLSIFNILHSFTVYFIVYSLRISSEVIMILVYILSFCSWNTLYQSLTLIHIYAFIK